MSNPYVYTPAPSYPTLSQSCYYDASHAAQQNSPFIPSPSLLNPSSPYTSQPGSPYLGASNAALFTDGSSIPYPPDWTFPRQRRPSWHGDQPTAIPASPFLQPDPFRDTRRHSFGSGGAPPFLPSWGDYNPSMPPMSPYTPFYNLPSTPRLQIHPFLNADIPNPWFIFDLSAPSFAPVRLVAPGQSVPLTAEELRRPATYPPVTQMRIVCDNIPQWPFDLKYDPYVASTLGIAPETPPPITLMDVLVSLHRQLQMRISHLDWAKLSMSEETAVTKIYYKRCARHGPREMIERQQGVKRVDFLLGKVYFKGLTVGNEVLKLHVG